VTVDDHPVTAGSGAFDRDDPGMPVDLDIESH
jgi:hypothetical protein